MTEETIHKIIKIKDNRSAYAMHASRS